MAMAATYEQRSLCAGGGTPRASRGANDRHSVSMSNASRYDEGKLAAYVKANTVIIASTGAGAFEQIMLDGRHALHADEPAAAGGGDTGAGPYELLLMALGSCTSMTIHLCAACKQWPLEQVDIRLSQKRVHVQDCVDCDQPDAMIHRIETRIELVGALGDEQRAKLLEIADRRPVHRTLTSKNEIHSAPIPAPI